MEQKNEEEREEKDKYKEIKNEKEKYNKKRKNKKQNGRGNKRKRKKGGKVCNERGRWHMAIGGLQRVESRTNKHTHVYKHTDKGINKAEQKETKGKR